MNRVTVNASLYRIHPHAFVGLDKRQAKERAHNLRSTDDPGVYEVLRTVEFKRGESLLLNTEGLSRAESTALTAVGDEAQPAEKRPAKGRQKAA